MKLSFRKIGNELHYNFKMKLNITKNYKWNKRFHICKLFIYNTIIQKKKNTQLIIEKKIKAFIYTQYKICLILITSYFQDEIKLTDKHPMIIIILYI